jgi:hypothetical protein
MKLILTAKRLELHSLHDFDEVFTMAHLHTCSSTYLHIVVKTLLDLVYEASERIKPLQDPITCKTKFSITNILKYSYCINHHVGMSKEIKIHTKTRTRSGMISDQSAIFESKKSEGHKYTIGWVDSHGCLFKIQKLTKQFKYADCVNTW